MFSGLCFSSLVAFKILSLSLTFGILSWVLVWDCFASSGLVLSHFLDLYVYFFCQVREVSHHYFSTKFSISCSLCSSSSNPMMWMLVHLKFSQRLLILSSNFGFFLYFSCSHWVFSAFLSSKSLPWSSASLFHCWFPVMYTFFLYIEFFEVTMVNKISHRYIFFPETKLGIGLLIRSHWLEASNTSYSR